LHRIESASCIIYATDIAEHASTTKRIKKTKEACRRSFLAFSDLAAETRVFDIPRTYFLTYRGELFADIVRAFYRCSTWHDLRNAENRARAISVRNVMRA